MSITFPDDLENDPSKEGQLATDKIMFGDGGRYCVYALHGKEKLQWFVDDAEYPGNYDIRAVNIRRAEALDVALEGFDTTWSCSVKDISEFIFTLFESQNSIHH